MPSRWSLIAGRLPGRTDNEIKNHWNTHLKKKLKSMGIDPSKHRSVIPLHASNRKKSGGGSAPGQLPAALSKTVHKLKAQRPRPSHHGALLDSDKERSNLERQGGAAAGINDAAVEHKLVKDDSEKAVPCADDAQAEKVSLAVQKGVAEPTWSVSKSSPNDVRVQVPDNCHEHANSEPEWLCSSPYFGGHSELDGTTGMAMDAHGMDDEESLNRQILLAAAVHNAELDSFPIEDCLLQERSMDYSSAGDSPSSSEEDDKFLPENSWSDIMNVDSDIPTLLSQYVDGPMIYNHEDLWTLESPLYGLQNS